VLPYDALRLTWLPSRDVHLATADGGNWNDRIDQVSVC
jgi:hypothetical protein